VTGIPVLALLFSFAIFLDFLAHGLKLGLGQLFNAN
jgi:hypothetical protein